MQNSIGHSLGWVHLGWHLGSWYYEYLIHHIQLTLPSIVNSWLTYAACFGVAFSYGGGLVAVFSPILSALTQLIMLQGVSELASAFPSSGVSRCQEYFQWYADKRVLLFRASITTRIL